MGSSPIVSTEISDEMDVVGFELEQHRVHRIRQSASAGEIETDGRRCGCRGDVQLPRTALSCEMNCRIPQRRGNAVAPIGTVDIQVREPRQPRLKGRCHDGCPGDVFAVEGTEHDAGMFLDDRN